jgi:hypothetical protein
MGELGKALAFWLVEQDIHEDICGVALESKWLSRSSDPAQGRSSLYSAADIMVPPYSGVRGRTPRPSPVAPTALAPVSTSPGKLDRTRLLIAIALVVALGTTVIFALTGPGEEPAETAASAAPAVVPLTPEGPREPTTAGQAVSEPAPSPKPPLAAESVTATAPIRALPHRKAAPVRSAPPPASASKSAAPKKSAPGDDLLSPY